VKLGLTNSLYGGAFNSRLVNEFREDKVIPTAAQARERDALHGYFLSPPPFETTWCGVADGDFLRDGPNCAPCRFRNRNWPTRRIT